MAFLESEPKDPSAVLDYGLDLAALTNGNGPEDYLQSGETIVSVISVVSSDAALVVDSFSIINTGTSILIWLSGGVVNVKYTITARFTTSVTGRIDERSFIVKIQER